MRTRPRFQTMYGCPACHRPTWTNASDVCPECGADAPLGRQWPLLVFKEIPPQWFIGFRYEYVRDPTPAKDSSR